MEKVQSCKTTPSETCRLKLTMEEGFKLLEQKDLMKEIETIETDPEDCEIDVKTER